MQKLGAELGFCLVYPSPILGYYTKPASVLTFYAMFFLLPLTHQDRLFWWHRNLFYLMEWLLNGRRGLSGSFKEERMRWGQKGECWWPREEPQDRDTEQEWGRAPQQLQSEEHLSDLFIGRENQSGIGEILLRSFLDRNTLGWQQCS